MPSHLIFPLRNQQVCHSPLTLACNLHTRCKAKLHHLMQKFIQAGGMLPQQQPHTVPCAHRLLGPQTACPGRSPPEACTTFAGHCEHPPYSVLAIIAIFISKGSKHAFSCCQVLASFLRCPSGLQAAWGADSYANSANYDLRHAQLLRSRCASEAAHLKEHISGGFLYDAHLRTVSTCMQTSCSGKVHIIAIMGLLYQTIMAPCKWMCTVRKSVYSRQTGSPGACSSRASVRAST